MRKLLVSVASSVIVAAGAGGAWGSEEAKRPASLRLEGGTPIKLLGAGFAVRERITVRVVSAGRSKSVRVRASRGGRFRVAFPGMALDRCSGFLAEAVGASGSSAKLKLPPALCAPS